MLEAGERVRHALEREREGHDAAAVGCGRELVFLRIRRFGVRGGARLLDRMVGQAVAGGRPVVRAAEGEHAGVLARAVVEDLLGRPALLKAELEVVLGRGRLREQRADGGDLVRRGAVGRGRDREVALVEVCARPRERSAWIGFDDDRRKQASPPSPASATTAPLRTATAWTRCRASTMPLRRTLTTIGSIGSGAYAHTPGPGPVTKVS